MIIRTRSYPRAALIGNPSDGYYGKTIAFLFRNFSAEVVLYESPELEILPSKYDSNVFRSIRELADDVQQYGYYGGVRLLKAAVKRFYEYTLGHRIQIVERNFTIRYRSDIPYKLGLAGSSAIITACMRAMMNFFGIEIPQAILANLVLSVEKEELGISAGLQDRVAQAFGVPVYMDFDRALMEKQGYGDYQPMDPGMFRNIYIAYRTDLSQGSEVLHDHFRERYNTGDPGVLEAIRQWTGLTDQAKDALSSGNMKKLNECIDKNFDIRDSVMELSESNRKMVRIARSAGASAKFTGSGGAIIGLYSDRKMYERLEEAFCPEFIKILKPDIVRKKA